MTRELGRLELICERMLDPTDRGRELGICDPLSNIVDDNGGIGGARSVMCCDRDRQRS